MASQFLQVANNLSDVASATTSRSNLGLTNIATQNVTQYNSLVGGAANAITSVSPGTAGAVYLSGGSSTNPSFIVPASGTGLSLTSNATTLNYALSVPVSVSNGGTGATTLTGLVTGNGTSAMTASSITNHNVLVAGTSNAVTSVAPGTAGIPLVSNGAASDPSFTTAVVAGGGSGRTSAIAYSVITGGTTSTGAFQSVASVGTSGQVLTSNGAGALPTFQTKSSSFSSASIQVFTSTGTYTPTAGMQYCIIEVVGAGGGSGGIAATVASKGAAAAGGGSGEYARGIYSAATIGVSQSVTIGTAGTAGTAGNNTGGTGGTSSVGALITAIGGSGGAGGPLVATGSSLYVLGGIGGTGGSGGSFRCAGNPGGPGVTIDCPGVNFSGAGGGSFFGGGAVGVQVSAGNPGVSYGGGASGPANSSGTTARAGAAGAGGIVIVTEYS